MLWFNLVLVPLNAFFCGFHMAEGSYRMATLSGLCVLLNTLVVGLSKWRDE